MFRILIFALLGFSCALPAASAQDAALLRDRGAADKPELMVLGTPHFANPARDVVNNQTPDILTPRRQAEVEAVVDRLARYAPTIIAVEWAAARQGELDERYQAYLDGEYTLSASEVDQLALRLAKRMGLKRVYGINWNEMPPGEIADFDYASFASDNGQADRLERLRNREPETSDEWLAGHSVTNWLLRANSPAIRASMHQIYFDYALIGDATRYPGANWAANWYGRNLKIFGAAVRLADRPDDRVLIIYGAGHGYLLSQFGAESNAFEIVAPARVLDQDGAP